MSTLAEHPPMAAAPLEYGFPRARMGIALLSLLGLLVSAYLTLYKLNYIGTLQCGAGGGCSVVQASQYAELLGAPVAAWGMGAYGLLLALALLGLQPAWAGARWASLGLFGVSAAGVAFSAYLTYLSHSVIGAYCAWCLVSAVIITLIFLLSIPGLRRAR